MECFKQSVLGKGAASLFPSSRNTNEVICSFGQKRSLIYSGARPFITLNINFIFKLWRLLSNVSHSKLASISLDRTSQLDLVIILAARFCNLCNFNIRPLSSPFQTIQPYSRCRWIRALYILTKVSWSI